MSKREKITPTNLTRLPKGYIDKGRRNMKVRVRHIFISPNVRK